MKLKFLGTGTSTGVPQLGCKCETCVSPDARDKRLRTSAIVETDSGENILIDCGPDFYQQMLACKETVPGQLLITHSHYDHVGGIDDLRPFCASGPFNVYCTADVRRDLMERIPYCFGDNLYPGVPTFNIHTVKPLEPFNIGATTVVPLPVMHHKLPILGFKIGRLAYITDCKTLPESTIEAIRNTDTLVINALRIEPHLSHLSLDEALSLISEIKPRVAYLTHISHQMGRHESVSRNLPPNVHLAYDGLTVEIPQ